MKRQLIRIALQQIGTGMFALFTYICVLSMITVTLYHGWVDYIAMFACCAVFLTLGVLGPIGLWRTIDAEYPLKEITNGRKRLTRRR